MNVLFIDIEFGQLRQIVISEMAFLERIHVFGEQ